MVTVMLRRMRRTKMTWRTSEMAGKWVSATAEWSKRGEAPASPQRRTTSALEAAKLSLNLFSFFSRLSEKLTGCFFHWASPKNLVLTGK